MPVERVGDAFAKLAASKNGTVLAVVANVPFFEVWDLDGLR